MKNINKDIIYLIFNSIYFHPLPYLYFYNVNNNNETLMNHICLFFINPLVLDALYPSYLLIF